MEVKNPITGNFEKVYVKALDSLPVGTIVDYVGQSSDIPIGWEIISGENKIQKTSETRALARKTVNTHSESTTDAYCCDYVNNIVKGKATVVSTSLNPSTTITFTGTTRGTYIITTTSNSGLVKGCWLILTGNASGTIIDLSGGTVGTSIVVSSNGETISVTNNSSYGTACYMITLADETIV